MVINRITSKKFSKIDSVKGTPKPSYGAKVHILGQRFPRVCNTFTTCLFADYGERVKMAAVGQ